MQEQGYQVGDLLSDAVFDRSRRRAVARVEGALRKDGIEEVAAATEADAEHELLSYPIARMVLASISDAYLTNRFAVAESKLLSARLLAEERDATVLQILAALGVPVEPTTEEDSFGRIHFLDYLRFAPARDQQWKLVNQRLRGGFVDLPRDRFIRLAEEAYREQLIEELGELPKPPTALLKALERNLNELAMIVAAHRARFQEEAGGEIRQEAFPPCMRNIWKGIQAHANIPHMGRFAIVSFLHKLGMDSEAILKFFSQVPDFDVNKSRYQIEHITGKIGGSTEYTTPSCSTMQTYGVCPLEERDEICLTMIKHPLSYYRKKNRFLGPPKAAPAAAAEPAKPPEAPNAG